MKTRGENHTPFIWLIGRIFVNLARLKIQSGTMPQALKGLLFFAIS